MKRKNKYPRIEDSIALAKKQVAKWPKWKREAMRAWLNRATESEAVTDSYTGWRPV